MKNYKLGNFVCELREEYGMDQKTLAALLGMSSSALSQCENGGGIKIEKLFKLSELFGVTLDELLECKRAEKSIEQRLDELYYISDDELECAIENRQYDNIQSIYRRIQGINGSYYNLLYKYLFAKLTDNENLEFVYLKKHYKENIYNCKYFTDHIICFNEQQKKDMIKQTLSDAFGMQDKESMIWELQKIYTFEYDYHILEIIEMIFNDDRIEHESQNMDCFESMFAALPKLIQDLLFSRMLYGETINYYVGSFLSAMQKQQAAILYPPYLKNKASIDDDVFNSLENYAEYDSALTEAVHIYQNNCINDLDVQSFAQLTYQEYQKCYNQVAMNNGMNLSKLLGVDKSQYWENYKKIEKFVKKKTS